MIDEHDPAHEQVVAAILCGERTTTPPEIEACPVCSEQLSLLQTAATLLEAAVAEHRAVLAEARSTTGAIGEDRVASLVREGLGMHGTHRRTAWPWWMLAAVLLGGALWLARGSSLPADRTLGTHGYWPTGPIAALDEPFAWPIEPGSSYRLLLYEATDDLLPWKTIPCTDPSWPPNPDLVSEMRGKRDDWSWVVETVRNPHGGGPPVIRRSERQYFSFSH